MNKFQKSQVLVLLVLVLLLVITPFLPSSLRPTYLYFILNFIIISLGAEAGLLSVFSRSSEHMSESEASSEKKEASCTNGVNGNSDHVENSAPPQSQRVVCVTKMDKMQKCPSRPSLFFIGSGEGDAETMGEEVETEEEIGGVNGQELFAKAEAFIGNFYKQLKMQREESWIHQKPFELGHITS
ncbi:uncharacterized protein LOC130726778 [Lotus japonicus]|uniref:uncharacterized protein LOC130726778 n=1 Tax=Lotus japonicus TaxID=34305 RepID=UPI00258376F9|nr:uncharacterized protein LOC130726778 [Lotus japonicus]